MIPGPKLSYLFKCSFWRKEQQEKNISNRQIVTFLSFNTHTHTSQDLL